MFTCSLISVANNCFARHVAPLIIPMENKQFEPLSHQRGYAYNVINPLLDNWLKSWNNTHPLLDIGCGDCTNTYQALEAGITVCATESEQDSVKALIDAHKGKTNINFFYLHFPDQVPFEDSSFSGILCSEVFHFLDHSEVIASVWELYRLLIPGGRVVLTCVSDDTLAFQKAGIKKTKAEQQKKFPLKLDAIHNFYDFLKKAAELDGSQLAWEMYEKHKVTVKPYFNCFDPDQLATVFTRLGFEIEILTKGPAPYYPLWEHGDHDQVRLVARKPTK